MPRGQSFCARCPGCKTTRSVLEATGRIRARRYNHGNRTGLADSTFQWEVRCSHCDYIWWSRHPQARDSFERESKPLTEIFTDDDLCDTQPLPCLSKGGHLDNVSPNPRSTLKNYSGTMHLLDNGIGIFSVCGLSRKTKKIDIGDCWQDVTCKRCKATEYYQQTRRKALRGRKKKENLMPKFSFIKKIYKVETNNERVTFHFNGNAGGKIYSLDQQKLMQFLEDFGLEWRKGNALNANQSRPPA